MNLKNATVNFLGDSITEGLGASDHANGYVGRLEKMFGLQKANNYGKSGTRIARQQVVTEASTDEDFCMRLEQMDESADAVVVFGGTNDYGHGEAPLGVPTDRTPDTFYGACHYLMNELLTRYAGKPVVIVTPLHRVFEDSPTGDQALTKPLSVATLKTYRDILVEVAEVYALPVLDLYSESGFYPENSVNLRKMTVDSLHPTDFGHEWLARRIGHFLEEL